MRARSLVWLLLALSACSRLVDLEGLSGGSVEPDAAVPGMPEGGMGEDTGPDTSEPLPEPDASRDATADAARDTSTPPEPDAGNGCPTGYTTMVRITAGEESFCIDEHEVTAGQYQEFIEKGIDKLTLFTSEGCKADGGAEILPLAYPPAPGSKPLPVVGISMCGAEAYCAHANKTLCGAIAGGPIRTDLAPDAQYAAFPRACSGPGRTYPYGDTYEPESCLGDDNTQNTVVPAGTLESCKTAEGVYDLAGNVWEWVDACKDDVSLADECRAQGGAFNSPQAQLECQGVPLTVLRATRQDNLGFRCCAP
jgi:sulfatase modifying factor 1